jgi:probable O-glycosylation ligase (exosortase A-associated)
MALPFIRYWSLQAINPWFSRILLGAVFLTAVAIIGTHSRGALLGIVAMGALLWLKSRQKIMLTLLIIAFIPFVMDFMPQSWFQKMETIETYEEDSSAMGRIEAWRFAISLAKSHPIMGGGFEAFTPRVWAIYSPDPGSTSRAAHSIYFQTLGEHGYVGLFIFLMLMFLTWQSAAWVNRMVRHRKDLVWASDLSLMLQVSLVGYAVSGAFLSLANFDLFYHLIAIIVVLRYTVEKALSMPPEIKDRGDNDTAETGKPKKSHLFSLRE